MEALVRVLKVDVLADYADSHLALRVVDLPHDLFPGIELGSARPDVKELRDLVIEALPVEYERDLVDALYVLG